MIMRCIVIDKELTGLQLISSYIDKFPALKLLQTFTDVLTGGEFLRNNTVDLLFIELSMADKSAIHLVNSIKEKLLIVFTVGCSQLPKEILFMDILDYLVKPFSYERFSKVALKAINKIEKKATPGEMIYVRSEYHLTGVFLDEIEYIESVENYIRIHLIKGRSIMSLTPLSTFMKKLPSEKFIRIHRKFIIAIHKIEYISNKKIKLSSIELPVSGRYYVSLKALVNK